jgi:hypothetical protein
MSNLVISIFWGVIFGSCCYSTNTSKSDELKKTEEINMKKLFKLLAMVLVISCSPSFCLAVPAAPELSYSIDRLELTVNWTSVSGADGYILSYAPISHTGPENIEIKDLGNETSYSYGLYVGAAFYIAVQAYDSQGVSAYSNVENFTIPCSTDPIYTKAETLVGSWEITRYVGISPESQGYIRKDEMKVNADSSCELFNTYDNGSRYTSWSNIPNWGYSGWGYNDIAECSLLGDELL